MIGIVDYGLGNLRSVQKSFEAIGVTAEIVSDTTGIRKSAKLVIPGVGAFGVGASNLRTSGLAASLVEEIVGKKKPVLGICLGMQLLARTSEEHGLHEGLGVLSGSVLSLRRLDQQLRVPSIGWFDLQDLKGEIFDGVNPLASFYYVHSYYYQEVNHSEVAARSVFGRPFACAIQHENIWATQFHPEKSQKAGLQILRNFSTKT